MKKRWAIISGISLIFFYLPVIALAQAMTVQTKDSLQPDTASAIESLRADIRADKVETIKNLIKFTPDESKAFWPIYNQYAAEMSNVNNDRIAVIKEYSDKYGSLSDADSEALVTRMFAYEQHKLDIRKKYFKEFCSKLPGQTVAKFFQLEHRFDLVIDVELAAGLPTLLESK